MSKHLTPAEVVERIIGRPEVAGPAIGMHAKSPYMWQRASSTRDAGDLPSARVQRAIHAYTASKGKPVPPEWLIWGATETEVEAFMAMAAQQPAFASMRAGVAAE